MKKTISLILISFLLCSIGKAQTIDDLWDSIPKGVTKIAISNELSADQNFIYASKLLLDNGYTFSVRDTELKYIVTEMTPLKYGSLKMTFRCQDSSVVVTGTLLSGLSVELYGVRSEDTPEVVTKRGMKKSIYGFTWSEMNRMAMLIPGKVSYQ